MKKVLLIDGDNLLKRNFMKRQTMFSKGEHCGGSFGFLDSLRSISEKVIPDRVVVLWDGVMSGKFRRDIYPSYKGKRDKSWEEESYYFTDEEIREEEERKYSILKQKIKVKNYLEELCVRQVEVEYIEADDLLGLYIKNKREDEQIVIYSSDKDFLHLIDEKVCLVRPSDGKIITTENFKEVIGYTHKNALFFKCLEGDVSDNITGVKGVGLKKLKTYMPRFFDEKYSLNNFIKEAEEKKKEKPLKFYDSIINGRRIIEKNRELMNLKKPMVNQKAIDEIEEIVDCVIVMPDMDKERSINNATRMMVKDGYQMHVFNRDLNLFFRPFYRIISREKEYSKSVLEKAKK